MIHDEINAVLGGRMKTGGLTDKCPECYDRGKIGTVDEWCFCKNCDGTGLVDDFYKDAYAIDYCKNLVHAHKAANALLEKCTEHQTPRLWHYWVKRLCQERGFETYLAPPEIIAEATVRAAGRWKTS